MINRLWFACTSSLVLFINPIVTGNVRTRKELLASPDSQILDISAGLDLFFLTAPQKLLFTAVTQNFLNIPFLGTRFNLFGVELVLGTQ